MWIMRIVFFPIYILGLISNKYCVIQKFKHKRKYKIEKVKKHLLKCIADYFIRHNDKELFITDKYCFEQDEYNLHEISHLFESWNSFKPSSYLTNYRNNCEIDLQYWFNWLANYNSKLFNIEKCDTSHGYKDDDGNEIASYILTNNGNEEPVKMIKITVR